MSGLDEFQAYVDQVRAANPIESVVRHYVSGEIQQRGNRLLCCSPFRNEKDPSMNVFPDQESWWDYGAQEGSDCFDLVQKCEDVDFKASVDILAERAGLPSWKTRINGEVRDTEVEAQIDEYFERRWVEKLQTEATVYYHRMLPPELREFLREHYGFTNETIDAERIGWADGSLFDYLHKDLGKPVDKLLATGLFRLSHGKVYEHHEDRLTFPYNRRGESPYLISRRVEGWTPDTEWQKAKYKKSLVHSERHPYVSKTVRNDVFSGEDSIRRGVKHCLIVEGKTDRITATQSGWPSISPVTVQFKTRELSRAIKLCRDRVDIPVILNDEEEGSIDARTGELRRPGLEGALKTAKAFFESGLLNVRIGRLPRADGIDKVDVNSFVRDNGAEALKSVVDGAKTYPRTLLDFIPPDVDPAELDLHLYPVYETVAKCPALQRDAYITLITRKFGLTKRVVREGVAEFLKKEKKEEKEQAKAEAKKAAKPPPSIPPPSAGGNGGSSGQPIGNLRGAIYESPDGFYYTFNNDGETERISNFVMTPTRLVNVGGEERFSVDVRTVEGMVYSDRLLPHNAFHSERDLIKALHEFSKRLAWSGTKQNVSGLVELLSKYEVDTYRGIPTLGYAETSDGPRWVLPDRVLSKDGREIESELTYVPTTHPPIANRLSYGSAEIPPAMVSDLAKRVLPKVFELNEPDVILPMLGWFYATTLAPAIRRLTGHFPLLWVWGTQGSSKTTTARDVFWRMLGVTGEPFSCSDTPFAMMVNTSATSSIPVMLDEFKSDLPKPRYEQVLRSARKSYCGEDESRGRADLRLNVYKIVAPLCIVGEQMPTEAALRERSIVASPLKTSLTGPRRKTFLAVTKEKLTLLAGAWVRFALTIDVEAALADADIQLRSMVDVSDLSPRLRDNLVVMILGNQMFDRWAVSLGVNLSNRPQIRSCIKNIVANITESEDGGGTVKTAVDRFLEEMSAHARLGAIQEGREYAIVGGKLCLHLRSCYQVYLQERRKAGQLDETNGYGSLRRAFREEMGAKNAYVTAHDARVLMPTTGKHIRAVTIDISAVPAHLDIQFEGTPREWGGRRGSYTDN